MRGEMERIVFLDRDAIRAELRCPKFEHEWREFPCTPPDKVVERLSEASMAIINRVFLREPELAQLPSLKFIAVAATGVDCVDLEACRRRGIAVSNVRNWSISVPEHIFALILALKRNLFTYHQAVQNGAWQQSANYTLLKEPMPHALKGGTIGIIGYGMLGQAVGRVGEAFGMKTLIAEHKGVNDLREGRLHFDDVLSSSDILVVLCPLTDETRGLIRTDELKKMPRHSMLINCARGGIVDDAALAAALKSGEISGAGVDVLSNEPPREGNPLLDPDLPNLIVTPHVAWASVEALQTLAEQLIDNIEAFVRGKPQNLVT